jgi:hypothetical protein
MPPVLKPGGEAVFQVYNRISWLNALGTVMKVGLEHATMRRCCNSASGVPAPVAGFSEVRIVPERFPVKSRLHRRVEGRGLQRPVRRDVQRAPQGAGPPVRLAPARVLHEMTEVVSPHHATS